MSARSAIGLDLSASESLAKKLNELLCNYQVFYVNVRGYHWNLKGPKFFELHLKFEELYTDLFTKIDEIAERVVTLGFAPIHSYSGYLAGSSIKEKQNVTDPLEASAQVLEGLRLFLVKQREILALSAEAEDEGTNALMSDYIREQEKLSWMYQAFLSR